MITTSPDAILALVLVAGSVGFLAGWATGRLRAEIAMYGKLVQAERDRYRAMFGEEG